MKGDYNFHRNRLFENKTFLYQKTEFALWVLRLTSFSPQSYKVEVQGQRPSLWDERIHPRMGFLRTHPFWNNAETFSDSEDMSIYWKGFSSENKKKKTMKGLRTNPFQCSDHLFDLFRIHLFQ